MIESDIKTLERSCSFDEPFRGIIDLAHYALDRHVISSTQSIGLDDLCAHVLGRSLRKNVPERIGEAWEHENLTEAQIEYAACDAYVALAIYNRLSTIPTPSPIQPIAPLPDVGSPVLLFNNGKTVIAHARIIQQPVERVLDGIQLDNTHVAIEVTRVIVPGALVHSHQKTPLKSFGSAPFSLVALRRNLRVFHPLPPIPPPIYRPGISSSSTQLPPNAASSLTATNEAAVPDADTSSLADLVLDILDLPEPLNRQNVDASEIDVASLQEGLEILGPFKTKWKTEVVSRVLKDPFHVFNMFYISATHGLRIDFAQALRDAMFIPDPQDAQRINVWGSSQDPPVTFEELRKYKARWLWRRCKRVIPPIEQLYPAIRQVFQTWGPLKDAETGAPLFNKAAWKTAKQILDLVSNGFLSDPPGVPLYSLMGIGRDTGLQIYRCFRGTNATEGGVHTHLRSHLPSSGTPVRHALACLKDFVLKRNLIVSAHFLPD
jgi:3'-5' exonuclease